MYFLIKCALAIGLVAFLLERSGAPVAPPRAQDRPVAAAKAGGTHARAAVKGADKDRSPAEALTSLANEGARRVAGAAAEHCVAHPRDCLEAAETLRRAGLSRNEPSR